MGTCLVFSVTNGCSRANLAAESFVTEKTRHVPIFCENPRPMGRIFEVRKHTMFARWDRMAKQFARIAKDINMAVKAGGSDPNSNPALRRAVQNSRNLNMPKDK